MIEGLVEIDKLVIVVLFDDPSRHGGHSLCAAGFSAARIPWGVQWGGPAQSTFFKNLLLQPMPGARGLRLDTASADLLRLALQLDRDIERHVRYGRRVARTRLQVPRLWAGFRSADAAGITGDGPELATYAARAGRSPQQLLEHLRRDYFGLALYPFDWVSHHWRQAVAVFADLERFPKRQVFPMHRLPDDIVGFQGAVEFNFYGSRFRRQPSAGCKPSRLPVRMASP